MNNSPAHSAWKRFIIYYGGVKGGLILAALILGGEWLTFILMPISDLAGFLFVTIHFVIGPPLAVAFIFISLIKLFLAGQWPARLSCLLISLPIGFYIYMAVTGDPRWATCLMPVR